MMRTVPAPRSHHVAIEKTALALLLCAAAASVQAQATRMLMPEGTYDLVLGVALGTTFKSRAEGGAHAVVTPALSVQWSNGAFIEAGIEDATAGIHLSDNPYLDYGVVASATGRDRRSDTPGTRGRVVLQAGGFITWQPLHNMAFSGELLAGGGFDGNGMLAHAQWLYSIRLVAHHGLNFSAGLVAADQRWMQGYFGVTQAQSAAGGNPAYRAAAGLVSAYGDMSWKWQVANKYWLNTGARVSRLTGPAAASPLVRASLRPSVRVALTYHF